MHSRGRKIYKTIFFVTAIIVIGKMMGFVREILIADGFGASGVVDTFLMAESASNIFLGWIASFATVFTPIYQEIKTKNSHEKADRYISKLLCFVTILTVISVIIAIILKSLLIRFCAPGFTTEGKTLTESFFIIVIWAQVFTHPANILIAYLNCESKKILSSIALLIMGVTQLLGVLFAWKSHNGYILSFSVVLSACAQLVYVVIISKHSGYSFSLRFNKDNEIKRSLTLVLPIFITSMITEINTFFDKLFASFLPEGGVSVLHYASRIRILFSYILSTLLQTILYPELAAAVAEPARSRLKKYVSESLAIVLSLFIPLTIGCCILSERIIYLIYGAGAFDATALSRTTSTFFFYSLSLAPLAIRDLLIRVLYSIQKTKYSMYIGLASVVCNVLFNMLFVSSLKWNGLALATSISAAIAVILYSLTVRKELVGFIEEDIFIKESIKIIISASIMGLIVWIIDRLMHIYVAASIKLVQFALLFFLTVLGFICYFVLILLFRVSSVK